MTAKAEQLAKSEAVVRYARRDQEETPVFCGGSKPTTKQMKDIEAGLRDLAGSGLSVTTVNQLLDNMALASKPRIKSGEPWEVAEWPKVIKGEFITDIED